MIRTRLALSLLAFGTLSACAAQVPDSGAGVGFTDYKTYREQAMQREEQLSGGSPSPQAIETASISSPGYRQRPRGAAPDGSVPTTQYVDGVAVPRGQAAAAATPGGDPHAISDEQNFDAVSERRTIETDAEFLEQVADQYVVIQPKPLPQRRSSAPNIVAYALSTTNPKGQAVYSRGGLFKTESQNVRNCGRYASADLAQEAFLAAGGPQKDGMNLDPDGDGYACGWDPRPFRDVARN